MKTNEFTKKSCDFFSPKNIPQNIKTKFNNLPIWIKPIIGLVILFLVMLFILPAYIVVCGYLIFGYIFEDEK